MLESSLAGIIQGTQQDFAFLDDRVDRRREEVDKMKDRIASLEDTIQVRTGVCNLLAVADTLILLGLAGGECRAERAIPQRLGGAVGAQRSEGEGEGLRPREGVLATGGKGSFTRWVNCEFVGGFETIRPTVTQRVRGEFFLKVLTKVPSGYFLNVNPGFF